MYTELEHLEAKQIKIVYFYLNLPFNHNLVAWLTNRKKSLFLEIA